MKYNGKKILLGVSGGIAAYKACELVRHFVKNGAQVRVVMTAGATRFVTPLTFETLSNHPVTTAVFPVEDPENKEMSATHHIRLAQWPDVFLIAPVTANVCGKIASGIADDALSTVALACPRPLILGMAMNDNMWNDSAVQDNVGKLKAKGAHIIEPDYGFLAEGYEGKGRLADLQVIIERTEAVLQTTAVLDGFKILVTAGPTREPIDPVRYITNHSSGKMGYALARQAWLMGAEVTLISGPSSLDPPEGVRTIPVVTAREMAEAVKSHFDQHDALIMAAAVADYRPTRVQSSKIKKKGGAFKLELEETEDILTGVAKNKGDRVVVGFALETDDVVENARNKRTRKSMDFIVVNSPTEVTGFNSDTNRITLLDDSGHEELPLMSKDDAAVRILDKLKPLLKR